MWLGTFLLLFLAFSYSLAFDILTMLCWVEERLFLIRYIWASLDLMDQNVHIFLNIQEVFSHTNTSVNGIHIPVPFFSSSWHQNTNMCLSVSRKSWRLPPFFPFFPFSSDRIIQNILLQIQKFFILFHLSFALDPTVFLIWFTDFLISKIFVG